MEVNKDTGLIDLNKMRANEASSKLDQTPTYDPYSSSPFKDRTLNSVLIPSLNVVGPHRLQHP